MAYEIEIKAYCHSHEEVRKKLIDLGGELLQELRENDIYFNHPVRDFRETDEAMRIRQSNGDTVVTYKGSRVGEKVKARPEYEMSIGDFHSAVKIFESLGFVKGGVVSKNRELYKCGDFTVVLDRVQNLGDFVEIEVIGEPSPQLERELIDFAHELGLEKFEKKSYLELLSNQ